MPSSKGPAGGGNSDKFTAPPVSSKPASPSPLGERVCRIVDRDPSMKGAAISYVTPDRVIKVRESDAFVQNHAVISPTMSEADVKNGAKSSYAYRLTDLALSCGSTALGASSVIASCVSTVPTLGVTGFLCAMSITGTAASALQCGASIGTLGLHIQDPKLADGIDEDERLQRMNDYLNMVQIVSGVSSLVASVPKFVRLIKFKDALKAMPRTEFRKHSKKLYRDLLDMVGEVQEGKSGGQLKSMIAARGHKQIFSPQAVRSELSSIVADQKGLALDGFSAATQDIRGAALKNSSAAGQQSDASGRGHVIHRLQFCPQR